MIFSPILRSGLVGFTAGGLALAAGFALPASAQRATTPPSARHSAVAPSAAPAADETFAFPGLGTVSVYFPPGPPQQVVLFLSGDGGWNLGVVPMAKRLAAEGALVAGIDIRRFFASLAGGSPCAYPAGTLEELSRTVQLRRHLPEYHRPILVGYSSGATLVYAALAQAPPETFRGAISLGFCSDLSLTKPLCKGRGLVSRPLPKSPGRDLDPFPDLGVPWILLHGDIDQVCALEASTAFVSRIPAGRIIRIPKVGHGFSVTSRWEPQYVQAYRSIAAGPPAPAQRDPGLGEVASSTPATLRDLGLVEVAATAPAARPALGEAFAVILSGDGGWAEIDKSIAARFAAYGVPTVGWSSLKYYWTPRTPEAAAADLARTIDYYMQRWQRGRIFVVGYSFGADVLPFLVNRLPPDVRSRVALAGLVGVSPHASFEFHVSDWLDADEGKFATAPEIRRLGATPVVCIRGDDETDSACGQLGGTSARVVTLPGGHHFGGDYDRLAAELLGAVR